MKESGDKTLNSFMSKFFGHFFFVYISLYILLSCLSPIFLYPFFSKYRTFFKKAQLDVFLYISMTVDSFSLKTIENLVTIILFLYNLSFYISMIWLYRKENDKGLESLLPIKKYALKSF